MKKEKAAKNTKEGLVIDKIIENASMEVPDPMVETTKEQMVQEANSSSSSGSSVSLIPFNLHLNTAGFPARSAA